MSLWVDGNDSNMESSSIMVPGTGDQINLWKNSVFCGECPLEEAYCKETEVGVHFW